MKSFQGKLRRDGLAILRAALDAADAATAVHEHLSIRSGYLKAGKLRLSLKEFDRVFLIAAGKAAAQMASAVEKIVGHRLTGGVAVTKYGHASAGLRLLEVIEAGHPIPDEAGVRAARTVQDLMRGLNARDLLLVAISGGASALLSAPAAPVTLKAKQTTTELLLRAGATIFELNAVRKHLSILKGGRLAALAYPATVVSLLLSDVIGDAPDAIGSGPVAPDASTFADAMDVLKKFDLVNRVPATVREHLKAGMRGKVPETPKPGDPLFRKVHNLVIGSNRLALKAAASKARSLGFRPLILSTTIQGDTREAARLHAEILREAISSGNPICRPACVLSGGETIVSIKGTGKGGRNQEFALAAALEIGGFQNVLILSAGTDGTDGPTDAAGAIATGETLGRAKRATLDPVEHLRNNDSYPFFDALGDLIRTGPTGTNVMDIHVLLAG